MNMQMSLSPPLTFKSSKLLNGGGESSGQRSSAVVSFLRPDQESRTATSPPLHSFPLASGGSRSLEIVFEGLPARQSLDPEHAGARRTLLKSVLSAFGFRGWLKVQCNPTQRSGRPLFPPSSRAERT